MLFLLGSKVVDETTEPKTFEESNAFPVLKRYLTLFSVFPSVISKIALSAMMV